MFCKNCGTKQKYGAKFCHSCGTPTDLASKEFRSNATIENSLETSQQNDLNAKTKDLDDAKKKIETQHANIDQELVILQKSPPTVRKVPQLVKCICNHCDQHIEFERKDTGETINCPSCNLDTILYIPEIPLNNLEELNDKPCELWNPKTAVFFGIFFLPVMIWVHAKNWEALKMSKEANYNYAYLILVMIYILIFLPMSFLLFPDVPDEMFKYINTAIIGGWISLIGLKQVFYVKKYINNFHKKSWGMPIFLGASTFITYFLVILIISNFTPITKEELKIYENAAVPVVTEIIDELGIKDNNCHTVKIKDEISKGIFKADAYLEDGLSYEIIIEVQRDMIYVELIDSIVD
tara:strand:- start:1325 stop:2377 length:1053 start_codon:yes stop_codon:yes gene_type:complete